MWDPDEAPAPAEIRISAHEDQTIRLPSSASSSTPLSAAAPFPTLQCNAMGENPNSLTRCSGSKGGRSAPIQGKAQIERTGPAPRGHPAVNPASLRSRWRSSSACRYWPPTPRNRGRPRRRHPRRAPAPRPPSRAGPCSAHRRERARTSRTGRSFVANPALASSPPKAEE